MRPARARAVRPGTSPVTLRGVRTAAGEVRRVRNSILGQMVTSSVCSRCQGMGTRIEIAVRGLSRRRPPSPERDAHASRSPPASRTGSTMRLADRGPAGARGGPNGRLFVHLRVAERPALRAPRRRPAPRGAHHLRPGGARARRMTVPTLRETHESRGRAGEPERHGAPPAPRGRRAPARPRSRRPLRPPGRRRAHRARRRVRVAAAPAGPSTVARSSPNPAAGLFRRRKAKK